MAHYMLQDDEEHALTNIGSEEQHKFWGLVGSPQSTLWSPLGSRNGAPRGPSREDLPSGMPLCGKGDIWDIPNNVVGEFEKMNMMNNEWPKYKANQRVWGKSQKPTSSPVVLVKNSIVGFHSNEALSDNQRHAAYQLFMLKQEQPIKNQGSAYWGTETKIPQHFEPKQQHQNLHNKSRASLWRARADNLSSNPWPAPPQQQNHQHPAVSVLLGGHGSRSRSCGTGVFLPRGINNPSERPKKPGSSTVLIPTRVVRALTAAPLPPVTDSVPVQHDSLLGGGDGHGPIPHKRHSHKAPAMNQYVLGLPQEWTY